MKTITILLIISYLNAVKTFNLGYFFLLCLLPAVTGISLRRSLRATSSLSILDILVLYSSSRLQPSYAHVLSSDHYLRIKQSINLRI